jgi:hypothetical protein
LRVREEVLAALEAVPDGLELLEVLGHVHLRVRAAQARAAADENRWISEEEAEERFARWIDRWSATPLPAEETDALAGRNPAQEPGEEPEAKDEIRRLLHHLQDGLDLKETLYRIYLGVRFHRATAEIVASGTYSQEAVQQMVAGWFEVNDELRTA